MPHIFGGDINYEPVKDGHVRVIIGTWGFEGGNLE
jgi:hypothetical protein